MNAKVDVSKIKLHTQRLIIRFWEIKDLEDFYEYAKVDGVGQMAGWLPHKDITDTMIVLTKFIEDKNEFAIEYNGKVIGSIGLENYNEKLLPDYNDKIGTELGFALSKDYWGQGIMTECVKEVQRYIFNDLKCDFIVCGHFKFNKQSERVQSKCGFRPILEHQYITPYGEKIDGVISILEREEYNEKFTRNI